MPLAATQPLQDTPANPVQVNPFVRAAQEFRQNFSDHSQTLGVTPVQAGPIDVAAFGFLRYVVLDVTTTGSAGAATFNEDGPWNVLQNVSLEDVNGRPIVGPISGHELYLMNKYGGLGVTQGAYDPASYPSYSASTANGSFSFKLRIPVEITSRDGFGCLANLTASATYKLKYTIADAATVYSSQPATTLPTVRVKAWIEAWSQPQPTDARSVPNETAPPMLGSTQFISKTTFNVSAGEQRIQLKRVGNLLRNIVFVYRDNAGARSSAEFVDDFRLEWDNKILELGDRRLWTDQMFERYGFTPDTGVYVKDFMHDADGRPGNENRHGYLQTVQGTRLEIIGNFGGSGGVLSILTNDVSPAPTPIASGQPR